MTFKDFVLTISLPKTLPKIIEVLLKRFMPVILFILLTVISLYFFGYYLDNGLGLKYNDARSHLDIGRRVVEGLKPGLAQLGSVWLPLPHALMIPTIWNDQMWHSGLSGALASMVSFVVTGMLVYYYLRELEVGTLGRLIGVAVFVLNLNILYLQSTAMTELLLIATMMAASYSLLRWIKYDTLLDFIKMSLWVCLATLVRYDGWFLLFFACLLIVLYVAKTKGLKTADGMFFLFCTLAGFGVVGWFAWNLLIFKDPLYFMFGPFSAHTQQQSLDAAGILGTKGNWWLSSKVYWYAMMYNSGAWTALLGIFGAFYLWFSKNVSGKIKLATTILFASLIFNILALYLGHSVLFIQGLFGGTWFNARYGVMLMPSFAIFIGYITDRLKDLRMVILLPLAFVTVFAFTSTDAVTIDDAQVGSSQKNVSEVSGWLAQNTADKEGFILISVASHDAIIFSSGLPMKRFIHEGTGAYWESALETPDHWARWIVMRTNDTNDLVFREVRDALGFERYRLVNSYPFADIYELKEEYVKDLETHPIFQNQKD